MSTTQPSTPKVTTAVQYDISMTLYALEKALSRLPPEVATDPLTTDWETVFPWNTPPGH